MTHRPGGSASVPPQVEDWTGIHGSDEGVNIGETTLLIGVGAGPVDLREKAYDLGTVQALRWHLEHQTQSRVRCHGTMLGGLELAHAALVRAPIPLPATMRHITVQASTTSLRGCVSRWSDGAWW